MNANELADYVDAREINNPHLKEAANMLRKQQAEIEEFKECIDELTTKLERAWAQLL